MQKEFKVWYNNVPATKEQLDAIEEIVVEQEVNLAWTAQIKIPICVRDDGTWDGENDPIYAERARVRIEAQIKKEISLLPPQGWVALIDGTIEERNRDLNAEPGLSSLTLVVKDDTEELHRKDNPRSFSPGKSDSEIAQQIFTTSGVTAELDIKKIDPPREQTSIVNQTGTDMQMLRTLVSRHPGFCAYVLPSSTPGKSKGCFRELPTKVDSALPELCLVGKDRNLRTLNISQMSHRATSFRGSSLNTKDLSVSSGKASYSDNVAAGGEGATTLGSGSIRERRLRPGMGDQGSPAASAESSALESSYTLMAEGEVLPMCYPAVLTPYKKVQVRLSNTRFSADYVIFKVTHTLGRSEYTQSFSLRGNEASSQKNPSASIPAAAATAAAIGAAAVTFNIQVDVF